MGIYESEDKQTIKITFRLTDFKNKAMFKTKFQ